MFYLGLLLVGLELLLQGGVLLLQGLHQRRVTGMSVLLQGQDGGIELPDLEQRIKGFQLSDGERYRSQLWVPGAQLTFSLDCTTSPLRLRTSA